MVSGMRGSLGANAFRQRVILFAATLKTDEFRGLRINPCDFAAFEVDFNA